MYCAQFCGAQPFPPRDAFLDLGVEAARAQLTGMRVPQVVIAVLQLTIMRAQLVRVARSFGLAVSER
eukprot:3009373-Prymnesium_polylepis.3